MQVIPRGKLFKRSEVGDKAALRAGGNSAFAYLFRRTSGTAVMAHHFGGRQILMIAVVPVFNYEA